MKPSGTMPNFVITKADQPPRDLTVSGALIGIGRDARNEICLTDPNHYVSRFHALLVRMSDDPERYFIRDLSSMSGLFVNGTSAYRRSSPTEIPSRSQGMSWSTHRKRPAVCGALAFALCRINQRPMPARPPP